MWVKWLSTFQGLVVLHHCCWQFMEQIFFFWQEAVLRKPMLWVSACRLPGFRTLHPVCQYRLLTIHVVLSVGKPSLNNFSNLNRWEIWHVLMEKKTKADSYLQYFEMWSSYMIQSRVFFPECRNHKEITQDINKLASHLKWQNLKCFTIPDWTWVIMI